MQPETLKAWELIRSKISQEDSWIQHRVSWLIASSAFLFGAYAVLAITAAPAYDANPLEPIILLLLIPKLGLLLSVAVLCGLAAAHIAIKKAESELAPLIPDQDKDLKLPELHSRGAALVLGVLASWGATVLIGLSWGLLLAVSIAFVISR